MARLQQFVFPISILLTLSIYALGVQGPFILDDLLNLQLLNKLGEPSIPWYAVIFSNSSGALGRSVSMVTFLTDYWLHGFSATWFKVTNLAMHLACGVSIYLFMAKALGETPYRHKARMFSAVATSLWLLSPLLTSTVLYVIQRMAILSAFFTFLALNSYLHFRGSLAHSGPRYFYLTLFFIFSLLGVFSKENAALIPCFVLVLEFFFCKQTKSGELAHRRKNLLVLVVGLTPLLLACAILLHNPLIMLDYSKRDFTLSQRFFTELRILWDYVFGLLVPQSSHFGLFHDDIAVSSGIFSPISTLTSALGWGFLIAASLLARRNDYWRPIAGGVAFFLAGHLLESTVLPLELYFEHRNYLPGVGVYLLLVLLVGYAVERGWVTLGVIRIGALLYGLAFCVALSQRALMWSDYQLLIYSSYEAHPLSARANTEAAVQDAQSGNFDAAVAKIQKVKELLPMKVMGANTQLMYTYCLLNHAGLTDDAIRRMMDSPVDDSAYTATGLEELNNLYRSKGCENVPYAEYISAMADRISRFYDSGEYKAYNEQRLAGVTNIQLRIMEGLNSLPKTDKTIELAEAINKAGQGGFAVDLLTAVALIDRGRMEEAGALIQKQKKDVSMAAQLEAKSLANVEQIYNEKMKGSH